VDVDTRNGRAVGRGGFSDVYKGFDPVLGTTVAVKVLRLHSEGNSDIVKNFAMELRILSRLNNRNVMKPRGYMVREDEHYAIVFEWMERGSLRKCMTAFSTRKLFAMSLGIAEGVCYLHDNEIIHGDIKADNVLVSPDGVPLLTDFGISTMKESSESKDFYSKGSSQGSTRWLAHDLLKPEQFHHTEKSDMWAFGMTVLELLTRQIPYAHITNDVQVILAILGGTLPNEPIIGNSDPDAELKHYMWSSCRKCWALDPKERPSMRELLKDMTDYHLRHLRS